MKHLKHFNESWHDEFGNLMRFSKDYLIYILDDIKIDYSHFSSFIDTDTKKLKDIIKITIKPNSNFDRHRIVWSDIKDYFIPYITLLNETYPIYELKNINSNFFQKFIEDGAISFIQGSNRIYISNINTIVNDELEEEITQHNYVNRARLDLEFLTEITLYVLL